jgi:glycosyltransferase involved in cell wall biosynthesis
MITNENSMVVTLAANEKFQKKEDLTLLDHTKIKYSIPTDKKYIFSLCNIEPRKNLIRAVRTFVEFINKNKINDLIWVMGGGQWDSFVEELEKQNIKWDTSLIIKAGYIDDEDLSILYSNAEWFVYTSQYEGFGLPPLEAMQCGCPVITSNNSSLPEVVGDAGLMIDWDSDEQHIEAYEKYYFNKVLRQENSLKGIERAKLFSWEKTVDLMVEQMRKAIS